MTPTLHSAVGALLQVFRWQYGLIVLAVAFLLFWDPINHWINYETMTVEVTAVKPLCGAFAKASPIPLEIDQCDAIRERHGSKPEVDIRPRTFASFSYTSPADGKVHSASVIRDLNDAGKPIATGDRITIEASRKDPLVIRDR